MKISVEVNICRECRHVDHSGSFTVRGARQICGHSDACKIRKMRSEFAIEYPEYAESDFNDKDWKFHWYNRIVDAEKAPPDWCPLRHGSRY